MLRPLLCTTCVSLSTGTSSIFGTSVSVHLHTEANFGQCRYKFNMDRFTAPYWDSRRAEFERKAILLPLEILSMIAVMCVRLAVQDEWVTHAMSYMLVYQPLIFKYREFRDLRWLSTISMVCSTWRRIASPELFHEVQIWRKTQLNHIQGALSSHVQNCPQSVVKYLKAVAHTEYWKMPGLPLVLATLGGHLRGLDSVKTLISQFGTKPI